MKKIIIPLLILSIFQSSYSMWAKLQFPKQSKKIISKKTQHHLPQHKTNRAGKNRKNGQQRNDPRKIK